MVFGKFSFIPTKQANGKVYITVTLVYNPAFMALHDAEDLSVVSQTIPSYLVDEYMDLMKKNLSAILEELA